MEVRGKTACFIAMLGQNYSCVITGCRSTRRSEEQMGTEYGEQIWKQFQSEIWQHLTRALCFA